MLRAFQLALLLAPVPVGAQDAAPPARDAAAAAVLELLAGAPGRHRIVSGQMGQVELEAVHAKTGVYPGILGAHYGLQGAIGSENAGLIAHWNRGGLVTVGVVWRNPVSGGDRKDTSFVDMKALLSPGTHSNAAWLREVDEVAAALKQLQDSGVPVLFRPFHEMNGDWFWWRAGSDPAGFKEMWRFLHGYMTKTKGLHNLIWVYAPNAGKGVMAAYPGNDAVDVVGLDYYSADGTVRKAEGYDELAGLGKPFALTEFGPLPANASPGVAEPRDYTRLLSGVATEMPRTSYWLAWNGVWAMDKQENVASVLRDPSVLNAGALR